MVNLILSSISNYTMSLCKLPKSVTHKVDSIGRKFFWDKSQEKTSYYAPMSWSKIYRLK